MKNQWSRYRGFPPEVLVFGKQRQVPASITSDLKTPAHMLAESPCAEGIKFRQELEIRERARRAFTIVDNNQAMRRAIVQRTRPMRQTYEKGQWVMMWRQRGEQQGQWIGPAQVIVQEGTQVVWITMSSKLYRIAPEHLRPVSLQEQASIKEDQMTNNPRNLGQGVTQFSDWTETVNTPIEPQIPIGVPVNNNTEANGGIGSEDEGHPNQNPSVEENQSQPDQEPSVISGNTPVDIPENSDTIDPSAIPIPSSDSEIGRAHV